MAKIEEILKVLDLPTEESQTKRLYELNYNDYFGKRACGRDGTIYECKTGSLADLAFRLRDEVFEKDSGLLFGRGMAKICFKIYGKEYGLNEYLSWCAVKAQPIHWIIAALIAKELAEASEEKDNG